MKKFILASLMVLSFGVSAAEFDVDSNTVKFSGILEKDGSVISKNVKYDGKSFSLLSESEGVEIDAIRISEDVVLILNLSVGENNLFMVPVITNRIF